MSTTKDFSRKHKKAKMPIGICFMFYFLLENIWNVQFFLFVYNFSLLYRLIKYNTTLNTTVETD